MGRHFPHIGKFFDICTFALRKTIHQTQTPTLFGFDSGGETLSFPHARPHLCVVCAHYCVWLCVLCVLCNLISVSLTENATHVFTRHGLCGNPLKETKISFQTEAKCWSPQIFMWLCHRWKPFHTATVLNWRLQSLVHETFLFSPMGGSLYHLAGDPEHLSQPRAEGNAPQGAMLANSEL